MGSVLLIKAIKPKKSINRARFRQGFYNSMRRVATQVRKDYARTTRTWEHKVEFHEAVSISGPGPLLHVWTDDDIYRYVDEGTRPHEIWAGIYTGKSEAKVLAFPGTFRPKTQPGVLGSSSGSRGGPMIFRPYVQHPGSKGRGFSALIEKKWRPRFKREMEDTLRQLVKESGMEV